MLVLETQWHSITAFAQAASRQITDAADEFLQHVRKRGTQVSFRETETGLTGARDAFAVSPIISEHSEVTSPVHVVFWYLLGITLTYLRSRHTFGQGPRYYFQHGVLLVLGSVPRRECLHARQEGAMLFAVMQRLAKADLQHPG